MPPGQLTSVVHLVRHGEVANPAGVLYGRIPGFGLSEDGQMMAKAAADFMAGRDVVLLKSSPLERAVQTAEPMPPAAPVTSATCRANSRSGGASVNLYCSSGQYSTA